MKAAVRRRYGSPDVLTVADLPTPVPGPGDVLIRVQAATVGVTDAVARRGAPAYARAYFGLLRPRFGVLGCDFAGLIEAAGPAVTRWSPGAEVFGTVAPSFGAHAEYLCLPETAVLATKPEQLGAEQAAALVDATALHFLRDVARLRPGQTVLVNGASGAVGSMAVQYARRLGARVTAVCSGRNAELVRRLGADEVIDYTQTDFTRAGNSYDVVFDVAATSSFARCRRVLNRSGLYLTTAPSVPVLVRMHLPSRPGSRRAAVAFAGLRPAADKQADLLELARLASNGSLQPVIDSCYPLARIADAHRRVDTGHKRGNVIVTMDGPVSRIR